MYSTNIIDWNTHKIFAAGIRLFELIKLSFSPAISKKTSNKESLFYVVNAVEKSSTVVDIGRHSRSYLFEMLKIAVHSEKLIVFESYSDVYNYLIRMKQVLRLKNVTIEDFSVINKQRNSSSEDYFDKKNAQQGATVIDMKERITYVPAKNPVAARTLDNYFLSNNIEPDLLKIKADGNELDILKDAVQTLQIYKPKILIECSETRCSRENLLSTFKWLTDLEYAGYFILDTLKIPLTSFDFNIYQNEVIGFYCNNFVFE